MVGLFRHGWGEGLQVKECGGCGQASLSPEVAGSSCLVLAWGKPT